MSTVHLIAGPQGAGKSTYSKKLSEQVKGVHLSIDDWMWMLYGADLPKSMNFKWIMERVERCEQQIWKTANQIANHGGVVILDLGFAKLAKRDLFRDLAQEQSIPTQLHYVHAPHSIRRKRVLQRNTDQGATFSFEVTPGMFDFMETEFQKPTEKELSTAIIIDTHKDE